MEGEGDPRAPPHLERRGRAVQEGAGDDARLAQRQRGAAVAAPDPDVGLREGRAQGVEDFRLGVALDAAEELPRPQVVVAPQPAQLGRLPVPLAHGRAAVGVVHKPGKGLFRHRELGNLVDLRPLRDVCPRPPRRQLGVRLA